MTQNEPLNGRYADLVPPKDALIQHTHQADQQPSDTALTQLFADLEHLYSNSSVAPSPLLTERIEAALQARADQMSGQGHASTSGQSKVEVLSLSQRSPNRHRSPGVMPPHQRAGSTAMTSLTRKRLSTIAAYAAAVLIVTLIGVLLYSMRAGGNARVGSGGGSFQQRLQQLGGTQIIFTGACPQARIPCPPISRDIPIIEHRLATLVNVNDSQVLVNRSGRLIVEVVGSSYNLNRLITLVAQTGELDIINTGSIALTVGTDVTGQTCSSNCSGTGGQYQVIFTGADLDPNSISAGRDPQTNQPIVQFAFAGAARSKFADYTRTNIGNYLTITLDNRVIESAVINSEITGTAEISGGTMAVAEAQNLATLLKTGALPVPLLVISYSQVKPATPFPNSTCGQPTPTPTPTSSGPTPTATTGDIATATTGTQSDGSGCPTPTVAPGNPGATPTATSAPGPTPTPGATPTTPAQSATPTPKP